MQLYCSPRRTGTASSSVVARKRTVRNAANYLAGSIDGLLAVARTDLAALEIWKALVQSGERNFDTRHYNEYLISEKFRRFDEEGITLAPFVK